MAKPKVFVTRNIPDKGVELIKDFCVAIELATQHTNHRAQAVYDRHGYVVDEEFRHYEKPLRQRPVVNAG